MLKKILLAVVFAVGCGADATTDTPKPRTDETTQDGKADRPSGTTTTPDVQEAGCAHGAVGRRTPRYPGDDSAIGGESGGMSAEEGQCRCWDEQYPCRSNRDGSVGYCIRRTCR